MNVNGNDLGGNALNGNGPDRGGREAIRVPRRRIAVLTAGLSQPSSSRLLADRMAESAERELRRNGIAVDRETFELRDIAREVTNNLITGFPSPALSEVIERITTADGLIAVTPIFTTSYSGLFKSFVDVLDPTALEGMPVLIGATGGTERHSLALDYAMRPLFTYLHAAVAPTAVYAASADWASGGEESSALQQRIDRAGAQFAAMVETTERDLRDPFELTADFRALGG